MYAKKNSGKKVVLTLLAIVLLIGCTIGGTLAWLTAEAVEVTNTFTAGNITITLSETFNTKSDANAAKADKWVGKIVPGAIQPKDPKVTVAKGSEPCYVYVLIDNTMLIDNDVAVTPNIDTAVWTPVATSGTKTLYCYKEAVDASANDKECPVFTQVTYNGALITETNITDLATKTIKVDAYAHQSDNLTNKSIADDAAKAHFSISSSNS